MSRNLNEHLVNDILKKESPKPTPPPSQMIREGENPVKKVPKPPKPTEPKILKEGEQPKPIKKKKPYYRKKYNKPKVVEPVIPESNNNQFIFGLSVGIIVTLIIELIIYKLTSY